jgi:hypothetical protein
MQRNHEMMQMLKLDLMTELHSSIETMLQKNLLKPDAVGRWNRSTCITACSAIIKRTLWKYAYKLSAASVTNLRHDLKGAPVLVTP